MYRINNRQKAIAKKLGVQIRPSNRVGKKIAVFKNGKKIADVGAKGYNDYHAYRRINRAIADDKRKLYFARHRADIKFPNPGYYAWWLLWN